MNDPVASVRTLVLVGVLSVGFVVAGSGIIVVSGVSAGMDSTSGDGPFPPSAGGAFGLATDGVSESPGGAGPVYQADPPGQTVTPGANASGSGSEKGNASNANKTTQPNGGQNVPPGEQRSANASGNPGEGPDSAGESGSNGPSQPPANDNSADSPGNSGSSSANDNSADSPGSDSRESPPNGTAGAESGPPTWANSEEGANNGTPQGPPGGGNGPPNGTSHTISVGGENVTITVSQGPPETTPGTQVSVHVANATPNRGIPVELPEPATNAAVGTTQLSVAVTERQNFSLGVTTRSERDTNRTPEFTPTESAEGIGYISVDHTVPDSEIENVTFRFTVDSGTITPGEREDIALYRHHNGSWNEVPTTYVDRNETAYIFEAVSPGLSEFTVGKKVANFEIQHATLETETQTTSEPLAVRVRITNNGGADGVYLARLLLDQEELAENKLSIAAGGTRQTSFEEPIDEPGRYTVLVNNFTVGTLHVDSASPVTTSLADGPNNAAGTAEALSDQSTRDATVEETESDPVTQTRMPGFGVLAGTIGFLVAALRSRGRR